MRSSAVRPGPVQYTMATPTGTATAAKIAASAAGWS